MPTRRKAVAQEAPQTIEEATALLARYSGFLADVETVRLEADKAIAQIEAARDALAAPIEQEAKSIFLQLRAWWGVAGGMLTEGKAKSTELAGCKIGERTTPPSLATGKLKIPEAVQVLFREAVAALDDLEMTKRLRALIRTKHELDKPAILKELTTDDLGPHLEGLGFKARQKEEFFIDRPPPKAPAVEEVADPVAAELEKAA